MTLSMGHQLNQFFLHSIRKLGHAHILSQILAIAFIVFGSIMLVLLIESRYRITIGDTLNTVLDSTNKALQIWAQGHRRTVMDFAADRKVIANAELLLKWYQGKNSLPSTSIQSLRQYFLLRRQFSSYKGFYIIGPENINLVSSQDTDIGALNLLKVQPGELDKLWSGETILSHTQVIDTVQRKSRGSFRAISMFVGTPIKNADGNIIALLTLEIDPYETLFPVLTQGRLGNSGESYAFDRSGLMLTHSRFATQLVNIGLIDSSDIESTTGEQPYQGHLQVRLIDPGVNLLKEEKLPRISKERPLTLMAASATHGQRSQNLVGYRDYRGVPVVGAWLWDESLNIGLTTEQDVAEAYALFYFIRVMIYAAGFFLVLMLLTLNYVFSSGRRQLQESQNRLKAVVEAAQDGVITADHRGRIESINPAVEKMFGYSQQELIGSNLKILMPEPYSSAHDGYLRRYLQTGDSKIIGKGREVEAKRANGSIFPMHLSISRLELDSGLHFSGIIRDVSRRKQVELSMLEAKEVAESANRAKNAFLANMSHEIRTPLNGMVGAIDMLAHSNIDQDQQELVYTALESSIMLKRIIDDVLDFAQIEAGRMELENIPLSLEKLLESVADYQRQQAIKTAVELLIYCDPRLPDVQGDPTRLKQILFNLVSNAIKFSSKLPGRSGRVIISITMLEQISNKVEIAIRIRDNGIGISSGVQDRLFSTFRQAEEDTTRRFGGVGLGLVITQRVVHMMNGRIDVNSAENVGTTFTVNLSLDSVGEQQDKNQPVLEDIRVLLVKSDNDAAMIMESYLHHAGAEVISTSPEQAWDRFRDLYDRSVEVVVVIDSLGYDSISDSLREALKQESSDIDINCVLIKSGQRLNSQVVEENNMTLDLNAMRRTAFVNAVAVAIGRESSKLTKQQKQELSLPDPSTIGESGKAEFSILLAEDNENNRKVISRQLNMLGYDAEFADDGQQALSMWQNGNYSLLLTDCHMPLMDGYELSRTIRTEERQNSRIPIVAITADALKGTVQECSSAGMDDYLTKPTQLHELDAMLEKWLFTTPGIVDKPQVQSRQPSDDLIVDPQVLGRLLGTQDPVMLAEFYNDFLGSSLKTYEEMLIAHSEMDSAELERLAHKLKSSARTVGANGLADCCFDIEMAGKISDTESINQYMDCFRSLYQQVCRWIEDFLDKPG